MKSNKLIIVKSQDALSNLDNISAIGVAMLFVKTLGRFSVNSMLVQLLVYFSEFTIVSQMATETLVPKYGLHVTKLQTPLLTHRYPQIPVV